MIFKEREMKDYSFIPVVLFYLFLRGTDRRRSEHSGHTDFVSTQTFSFARRRIDLPRIGVEI